jgi:hypothetical protein
MTKPLRVSWSSLRSHEECHEKGYLKRDGKRAKVTNIRNFYPGSVVDHAMRLWLDLPANSIRPPMTDLVTASMDDTEATEKSRGNVVRFRDAEDRNEVRKFCLELVSRLEPILTKHVLPYDYEHGKWFKVPLSIPDAGGHPRDILLTGEMDLIVDADGPVVWDLKGTADNQYWRKVVAQLIFYDLAVWIGTGRKTRFVGLIQPMCDERLLPFEVTDADRSQMMLRIQRFAHDVWAGERTLATDSATCHWCDVRHACSKFAQPKLDAFGDLAGALRQAAAGEPA